MLFVVLVGVGVVLVVAFAAFALRRRSHDDAHSVEHYHRQLHTLEEMRTHPPSSSFPHDHDAEAHFPASAVRVAGPTTVRLTEPGPAVVPPVPPPPVANAEEAVTFDAAGPDPAPGSFMTGNGDPAMHSINQRPRRLGAPLAAVGAVALLVIVLIVTGLHGSVPSPSRNHAPSTASHTSGSAVPQTSSARPPAGRRHPATTATTATTAAPAVSAPVTSSAHAATYRVASGDYALILSGTTGQCWVEVTSTTSGAVLYTATLLPGQSHSVAVSGTVTVVVGAPGVFAATVDGAPVTLPSGVLAPLTLNFAAGPSA